MNPQMLTQSSIQPAEQRLVLEGISWQQYEILLATLGDEFPNLRLNYLEGTLEIMTNSPEHEELKKVIGMLLEAYFQETRTRFHALGSATFRKAMKLRGLEPDEGCIPVLRPHPKSLSLGTRDFEFWLPSFLGRRVGDEGSSEICKTGMHPQMNAIA